MQRGRDPIVHTAKSDPFTSGGQLIVRTTTMAVCSDSVGTNRSRGYNVQDRYELARSVRGEELRKLWRFRVSFVNRAFGCAPRSLAERVLSTFYFAFLSPQTASRNSSLRKPASALILSRWLGRRPVNARSPVRSLAVNPARNDSPSQ